MQLQSVFALLTLTLTGFTLANPVAPVSKRAISGHYFVTTYGSTGCSGSSQGTSHFDASKYECAQMGNAQSFSLSRAIVDQCTLVEVTYHHNADCPDGEDIRTANYALPGCVDIPTDIGDHFSATFKCIA